MGAYVKNLQGFNTTIARARAAVKAKATERYRAFVKQVLRDLARNTPQWSGDLAASWQVVVGKGATAVDKGYTDLKLEYTGGTAPHKIGDRGAVNFAVKANSLALKSIRWNSNVSIENVSQTLLTGDGLPPFPGPISEDNLRIGNYILGDIMAVKTVAAMHKTSRFTYGIDSQDLSEEE